MPHPLTHISRLARAANLCGVICLSGLMCLCLSFAREIQAQDELCIYQDDKGAIVQVNSPNAVPTKYKDRSRCIKGKNEVYMASPNQVELEGSVGNKSISTPLGNMQLRWSREVGSLFRRSPEKALLDAANASARAIRGRGFPTDLYKNVQQLPWNVVFMNENVPQAQIPSHLISNCHPAWMTPPANLYIVAERVVAGCDSRSTRREKGVSDAELASVLIHEMGHAIEYAILQQAQGRDRMRAEGFASWFEQYASDNSAVVKDGSVRKGADKLASSALQQSPSSFNFTGSAQDYARASMYFHAITKRVGISGLMRVYDVLRTTNLEFFPAIEKAINWNKTRLEDEVSKLLK